MKIKKYKWYLVFIGMIIISYIFYSNLRGYQIVGQTVNLSLTKTAWVELPLPENSQANFIIKQAGWGYLCMAFIDLGTKPGPIDIRAPGFIMGSNLCIYNSAIEKITIK